MLPAGALPAAAGSLALGAGGGLDWLVGALVGGIAASCPNARVLLGEIRR
ncbi:hypothetical protein ACI79J_10340 [Geodermatophilus sp. SYSU D01062]